MLCRAVLNGVKRRLPPVASISHITSLTASEGTLGLRKKASQEFQFPEHLRSSNGSIFRFKFVCFHGHNPAKETSASDSCWNCGSIISDQFFCQLCGSILPIQTRFNLFDTFGIEPRFSLDTNQLESKYKSLQKRLHPDLFGMKSSEEKSLSAQQSSHVIDSYYTLLRPLSRAKYLLKLKGKTVSEEARMEDQALLMEVMEIRERIEETVNQSELSALLKENEEKMAKCEEEMRSAFDDNGDLDLASALVQRYSYYLRIQNEIIDRQ